VILSGAVNATLGEDTAQCTILDDDSSAPAYRVYLPLLQK
jgi:hypothetical protein